MTTKVDILTHILSVIEMDPEEAKTLMGAGITTPRILLRTSMGDMQKLVEDRYLTDIQLAEVLRFRRWLKAWKDDGNTIPTDLDQWKAAFTEDAFEKFCEDEEAMFATASSTTATNTATGNTTSQVVVPSGAPSTTTKKMVKVSLSDFPEFNGRQESWNSFNKEVISTMGLLQLKELLTVMEDAEVQAHEAKLISDPEYATRVTEFFSVLAKKTAKGTASSKVDKHLDTMDGVLVWRDFKKFYDFGGNKDTRTTTLLGEITNLKLFHDSHGGFDKYYNAFEEKCLELYKMKHPLDDVLKKTLFLNGIHDNGYQAVKDDCKREDYETTVDLLRDKARELGRTSGRSGDRRTNNRRSRNKNNNPQRRQNNKQQNNRNSRQNNRTDDYEPGSGFDREVWSSMSKANRDWITKNRKDKDRKQDYGQQYSTEDRRTNNTKTNEGDPEPEPEKKVSFKDDDKKQSIFRKPNGNTRSHKMLRRVPEELDADDQDPAPPTRVNVIPAQPEELNHQVQDIIPVSDKNIVILEIIVQPNMLMQGDNVQVKVKSVRQPGECMYLPLEAVQRRYEATLVHFMVTNYTVSHGHGPTLSWLIRWANTKMDEYRESDNTRSINQVTTFHSSARLFSNKRDEIEHDGYTELYIDSGADASSIGGEAWIVDSPTGRTVNVTGYDELSGSVRKGVMVAGGITATDLPTGETVLLRVNEATIMDDANNLLSSFQARDAGTFLDERAKQHGGLSYIGCDGYAVPLSVRGGLMAVKIRRPTKEELATCDTIELTSDAPWHPQSKQDEPVSELEYDEMVQHYEERRSNLKRSSPSKPNESKVKEHLLFPSDEAVTQTIQHTTCLGDVNQRIPMRQHMKSRNELLQRRRLNEKYATDTWFSTCTSYEGYNCAQAFYGMTSTRMHHFGLKREADGAESLLEFFRQVGVPISLRRDNSKMQSKELWQDYMRKYWVKDEFTEPLHPHQNPAERGIGHAKEKLERLFISTGCEPEAWFRGAVHIADVDAHTAKKSLEYKTPMEHSDGFTPDISGLLKFKFWELVYYYDTTHSFPTEGGNEKLGRWMGRALDHGDGMCYWILTVDTKELIVRSMVRSATDLRPNAAHQLIMKEELAQDEARKADTVFPVIAYETGDKVTLEDGTTETRGELKKYSAEDLLDLNVWNKHVTRTGKVTKIKGKVIDQIDEDHYRVEYPNGSQDVVEYNQLIDMMNKRNEENAVYYEFDSILDHRWSKDPKRKSRVDVLVGWVDQPATWEPMEVIKKDDPITLAAYAKEHGLVKQSIWKWADKPTKTAKKLKRALNQVRMFKRRTGRAIKYQFGVRVPRTTQEALLLDRINGNTKWKDAIGKEVKLLRDTYECFRIPDDPTEITDEYQQIPLLWTYAVKFDGRFRARCVAGGHKTEDITFDLYSGVVDLENVRLAFLIAILMDLNIVAADIGSAYIQALTIEKIFCIPGQEFGEMAGIKVIIVKALYGLKLSSAMWHQMLSDTLREMGFVRSKADYDLWMRKREDHYEYIAVIVDDLLIFSKNPEEIIEPLQEIYGFELKGVGEPEYYSGADVKKNDDGTWEISARTYIKGVTERIEKLYERKLKCYGSPMEKDDHPELDDSDFLQGDEITRYQMLIGCAQWAVSLGRWDIQYAVNTMARFAMMPREGHLRRMMRLFGYLKYYAKARNLFDPTDPSYDDFKFTENDWEGLYPDSLEEVDPKAPEPVNDKELSITLMLDASHGSDKDTYKSVSSYLLFVGKTVVKSYSKRQNTIETSTYGSELVASRIGVEAVIGMRYKLRMLGLKVTKPAVMLCDNMSVVHNMQLPSGTLKKKHQALSWHKCREAMAIGIARMAHIGSYWNIADINTKAKGPDDYYRLLKEPLYGKVDIVDSDAETETEELDTADLASRGVTEG